MGAAGPHVSAAVRNLVEHKGIHYYPDQYVSHVGPHARQVSFASGLTTWYDVKRGSQAVQGAGCTIHWQFASHSARTLLRTWNRYGH
jgi:sulfide:quinone oxidoreductase